MGNLDHYTYTNGVKHACSYDERNRLMSLTLTKNSGATLLRDFVYSLDAAGHRIGVLEHELSGGSPAQRRRVAYEYDVTHPDSGSPSQAPRVHRLTQEALFNAANNGAGSIDYRFDPVGNRVMRAPGGLGTTTDTIDAQDAMAYDDRDRMNGRFGVGAFTSTDANGNTIKNEHGDETQDLYDAENRLIQRNTSTPITVDYDHEGNRVKKTVGSAATYYLVDNRNPTGYAQVLAEYSSTSSAPERQYVYGNDLVAQRRKDGSSWLTSYYGYDGQGSVRLLLDSATGASTAVTDTYDYDAYGMMLAKTGTTPNNYLYCGEQWDSDLGMVFLRARYYRPNSGRFWTMDTFEGSQSEPLSLHKYLYCYADPINRIDPSGHFDFNLASLLSAAYVHATLSAATFITTYGALAETAVFVGALTILNSAQILSTGIDPDTGEPATAMATAFAIVDFLPAGKLITKPLKEVTKRIYWRAAENIWDGLSRVSRAGGQVHHRIPLEWAHLFPNMNPNRISNLKLVPTEIHRDVDGGNSAWTQLRNSLGGRTPTAQEVLDKAAEIDTRFGQHFKDLK